MKTTIRNTALTSFLLLLTCITYAQTQKGSSIYGPSMDSFSGTSLSMPDANTIAIGSPHDTGLAFSNGRVQVFEWSGGDWIQKGGDIYGMDTGVVVGYSVSMPNANTLAVGSPSYDTSLVYIYKWNGNDWIRRGSVIKSDTIGSFFGGAVNMPDTNTIAIGDPRYIGTNSALGRAYVYEWNGNDWVQKGQEIWGEAEEELGYTLSMPDANTIAIGAPRNNGGGLYAGHVRIYSWNGNSWAQKGEYLEGDFAFDLFGHSVSMADANTLAVGIPNSFSDWGSARVYEWNDSNWVQKGAAILGELENDYLGYAVTMPAPNIVGLGAYGHNGRRGKSYIYFWDGDRWVQRGTPIEGDSIDDFLGSTIHMPNSNILAVGATGSDGNGNNSGQTKIFDVSCSLADVSVVVNGDSTTATNATGKYQWLDCNNNNAPIVGDTSRQFVASVSGNYAVEIIENGCADTSVCVEIITTGFADLVSNSFQVFPNPTSQTVNIAFEQVPQYVAVTITGVTGKVMQQQTFAGRQLVTMEVSQTPGVYFIHIETPTKSATTKLVVR